MEVVALYQRQQHQYCVLDRTIQVYTIFHHTQSKGVASVSLM